MNAPHPTEAERVTVKVTPGINLEGECPTVKGKEARILAADDGFFIATGHDRTLENLTQAGEWSRERRGDYYYGKTREAAEQFLREHRDQQAEPLNLEDCAFVECDSCRAKPGTPFLCNGCLRNRFRMTKLVSEIRRLHSITPEPVRPICNYCGTTDHLTESPAGERCREQKLRDASVALPAEPAKDYGDLEKRIDAFLDGKLPNIEEVAAMKSELATLRAERDRHLADFKNFHRSLCERFGYHHDEADWPRDLVSLEEHVATLKGADQFRGYGEPGNPASYEASENEGLG